MTDTIFALVTAYGAQAIFASAFLSCLALPIPTSLMMLSGGAFAAVGDLDLAAVMLAAFTGAILGDQTGFALGRWGGTRLVARLARSPARAAVADRARRTVDRHGSLGVFLSTWAVAPLGPWVNFIAGAAGLGWLRFTLADVLGEAIWVTIYVGLGLTFASQLDTAATLAGNIAGLLAALTLAAVMIWWIAGALGRRADR